VPTATASDNAYHAIQNTFNDTGSTSNAYVDGSATANALGGVTSPINGPIFIGSNTVPGGFFTGLLLEVGIWPLDFTVSSRQSLMNTNQHSSASGYNF
jgi:hypothetical protein